MEEEAVSQQLVSLEPELQTKMKVDQMLLAFLRADDAIDDLTRERIQANNTNASMVAAVINHVRCDVRRRINPLLKALQQTNQPQIVDLICQGLNVNDDKQVEVITQSHGHMASRDKAFELCIELLHKQNLLFSKNLSVFKDCKGFKSYTVNLSELFTRLCLMDESSMDENDEIQLEEALKSGVKNIFFIGSPGSGKSSLLLRVEDEWGQAAKLEGKLEQARDHILANVKSIIYIRPQDCKTTLQETIESILEDRCGDHKQAAIEHFQKHPEETALLIDSIDEISGKRGLVEDIFRYMKKQKGVVLAGVRTNHPVLDEIHHVPHIRRVKVEGFRERDIHTYIEKFFQWQKKPNVIEEFQRTLSQDERLTGILMNPLVLCLVCILINEGACTVAELKGITRIKIYTLIEELVIQREGFKDNIGNLEKFHKYCLKIMLEEGSFFIEEMKSFGINPHKLPFVTIKDVNLRAVIKGQEVVWPHRSFIEFGAAKYIADSKDDIRDRLLIYIAGQRQLNNLLNFLLELLPLTGKEFKWVMNVILALQAEIKHFGFNWHRLICYTPYNRKIVQALEKLTVMDLLQDTECHMFKHKMYRIKPCRKCWLKSKHAWTDEGRAITQNVRAFIHMIPDESQQKETIAETIGTLFPDGLSSDGLDLIVKGSDRHVNVGEDDLHSMVIKANHPSDIRETKAFGLWGSRILGTVKLHTGETGGTFGDPCREETSEDWRDLLLELIQSTPNFEGKGLPSLKRPPETTADVILQCLTELHQDLEKHGIQEVRLSGAHLKATLKVTELRNKGWNVKLGRRALAFNPPQAKIKIRVTPTVDGLALAVPESTRHVSVKKKNDTTLTIMTNNFQDIIATKAFLIWGSKKLHALQIFTGKTDGIYGNESNPGQHEDLEALLKELIKSTGNLEADGNLSLTGSFEKSSTIALLSIADLHDDLYSIGIHEIRLQALQPAEKASFFRSNGWKVGLNNDSLSMVPPQGKIQIKLHLGTDGVTVGQDSKDSVIVTANHPRDIIGTNSFIFLGDGRLQAIKIHTGQTGNKYGSPCQEETPEDWTSLLNELIQNSTHFSPEGLLSIRRSSDTTADVVIMSLVEVYEQLAKLRIREVNIYEHHLQTGALPSELRSLGWQVKLSEGVLLMVSPKPSIHIHLVLEERQILVSVPGTGTNWVSIEETQHNIPIIMASHPGNISTSRAFSLWGNRCLSGLELYTREDEVLYGHMKVTINIEDWSCLLSDLIDQGPQISEDGSFFIHHISSSTTEDTKRRTQLIQGNGSRLDDLLSVLIENMVKLHDRGFRRIMHQSGEVTAKALFAFICDLSKPWDLKQSWVKNKGVSRKAPNWFKCMRLQHRDSTEKMLSITLWNIVITCSRLTEMEEAKDHMQKMSLCTDEKWQLDHE